MPEFMQCLVCYYQAKVALGFGVNASAAEAAAAAAHFLLSGREDSTGEGFVRKTRMQKLPRGRCEGHASYRVSTARIEWVNPSYFQIKKITFPIRPSIFKWFFVSKCGTNGARIKINK